jgi:hypothetical protein
MRETIPGSPELYLTVAIQEAVKQRYNMISMIRNLAPYGVLVECSTGTENHSFVATAEEVYNYSISNALKCCGKPVTVKPNDNPELSTTRSGQLF